MERQLLNSFCDNGSNQINHVKEALYMKSLFVAVIVSMLCSLSIAAAEDNTKAIPGEKLFAQHCAVCHPQGGNIVNSKKTLGKKALAANNIKTETDIIKVLRNGASGMPKFDEDAISKKDAQEITHYILNTFK
jgi:cytochrome c6